MYIQRFIKLKLPFVEVSTKGFVLSRTQGGVEVDLEFCGILVLWHSRGSEIFSMSFRNNNFLMSHCIGSRTTEFYKTTMKI